MGKHTAYWQDYQKTRARDALRIAAALGGAIVFGVLLDSVKESLGGLFPVLMGALFVGDFFLLVALSKNVYAVICPECGTHYERSKWSGECPSCGLKVLQEDI